MEILYLNLIKQNLIFVSIIEPVLFVLDDKLNEFS